MQTRIPVLLQFGLCYLSVCPLYAQTKNVFSEPKSILLFGVSPAIVVNPTSSFAISSLPGTIPQNPATIPAISPEGDRIATAVKLPDDTGATDCEPAWPKRAPRYKSVLGVYSLRNMTWGQFGSYCFVGSVAFSPDGKKVAFAAQPRPSDPKNYSDAKGLMILDLDTNELTPVPDSHSVVSNAQLSWSPDGRYLAVAMFERGTPFQDIVLIEIGSWRRKIIAHGDDPSWSPKGDWIAYSADVYRTCMLVHPDGTGARLVLDLRKRSGGWGFGMGLVWSPNGGKLLMNEKQIDGHHQEVQKFDLTTGEISTSSKNGPVVFGWAREPFKESF